MYIVKNRLFKNRIYFLISGLMTTNAEFDREADDGARSSLLQNGQTNVTPRIEIADKNDNPLEVTMKFYTIVMCRKSLVFLIFLRIYFGIKKM